jgi:Family of unknown function (DUF5317)
MKLFALVIVFAVLVGYLTGGRLSRFESMRLKWWWLAILGLGVQFVPLPEGTGGTDLLVRTIVLSLSYTLLLVFAAVNLRIPGMVLVLIGLACNFAVIAANGGMPVRAETLRDSGQEDVLALLQQDGAAKHHLMTDDDVLPFLGDVIAVPQPVGQAISIGDVFMYAGLIWLIVGAMRARTPSTSREEPGPRRGKHRPGGPATSRVQDDFGFLPPGARKSGTAR